MDVKVLVTGSSVDGRFLAHLSDAGLRVHNPTHLLTDEELRVELSDTVAYLLGGDEYASGAAMESAEGLKIIAFLGVGYESFIDVQAASRRGILVSNTPGTLTNSVAEFTVGQLLNARRRLTQFTNAFVQGRPGTETKQRDLIGTRVGIVGLGTNGTRIAEILRLGFGCHVNYFSRTRKFDIEDRLGIAYQSLDELMEWAEAYVIMTPGNDSTRDLIGKQEFARIPANSQRLLVNTARSSIVNPKALLEALRSERLSIAVFDGFYDDDCVERSTLLALGQERILVTGHIASLTSDARDAMSAMAVTSILNVLRTGRDDHVVIK